jgi:Uri superfamily endonuclease
MTAITRPVVMINQGKGTYLLQLRALNVAQINVGKLGLLEVLPGYYAYLGSAFGPGGLNARIRRHLRRDKKLRWHIDYLRKFTLDTCAYYEETSRKECLFANELVEAGGRILQKGFGSSDCSCDSHLVYFEKQLPIKKYVVEHNLVRFQG